MTHSLHSQALLLVVAALAFLGAVQSCTLHVEGYCRGGVKSVDSSSVQHLLATEFANSPDFGAGYNWNNSFTFSSTLNETFLGYSVYDPAYTQTKRAALYCVNSDVLSSVCDRVDEFAQINNSTARVKVVVACSPSPSPSPSHSRSPTASPSRMTSPSPSPVPQYSPLPNVEFSFGSNLNFSVSTNGSSTGSTGAAISFSGLEGESGSSLALQGVQRHQNNNGGNPEVIYLATIGNCAVVFNYTMQAQPVTYNYGGMTFQPPRSSTKWSVVFDGEYPFGSDPTFKLSNTISSLAPGSHIGTIDRLVDHPMSGMTTYLIHFAEANGGTSSTLLQLSLFDSAYVDGALTTISHSVTVNGDKSAAKMSLQFPRFSSRLYYDPITTLSQGAGSTPSNSPASGTGGGGGSDIGLVVGLAAGLGGAIAFLLLVIVIGVIVLVVMKRKNHFSGSGSAQIFLNEL